MRLSARFALMLGILYISWLGMMAVHEAGHVLHARVSGGVVERVHIPPVGFSQTFYSVNPRPHFVAWGGAVWGSVIPLMFLAVLSSGPGWVRRATQFFAGFCLIANGVYLGIGWTTRAGDAGDLLKHGTPLGVLFTFGVVTSTAGLYLWHRMSAPAAPAGANASD